MQAQLLCWGSLVGRNGLKELVSGKNLAFWIVEDRRKGQLLKRDKGALSAQCFLKSDFARTPPDDGCLRAPLYPPTHLRPILTDQLQIPKDQYALVSICLLFQHFGEPSLPSSVPSIFIATFPHSLWTGPPEKVIRQDSRCPVPDRRADSKSCEEP